MAALKNNSISYSEDGGQLTAINTTLYELIEAVILSARPDEDHMTDFIVSHMLDSGHIRLSKRLVESTREKSQDTSLQQ